MIPVGEGRSVEGRPERRWGPRAWVPALFASFLLASCDWEGTVCNNAITPPIAVRVRDAATGAPSAVGATGTIRNGDFSAPLVLPHPSETLELYSDGPHATYDVVIQKPGYRDWESNGVYVPGGKCGVHKTIFLNAALQRVP